MKDRTEDVKREWQEGKEQDFIHKTSREGDTKRSKSAKLVQEDWTDEKIKILQSLSTLEVP